jgi:hypothetical protein
MSDMERRDDETEVEGHASTAANPEQIEEDEDEFEAHIKVPNVRMDSPSNT